MTPIARTAFACLRAYSRVAPTERGGLRLVHMARRLLPRDRWQDRWTTPDGLTFRLDLGTYPDCCMAVGLYELDTARWLRRLLRPGMSFADCGANIGYFTLLAARLVGPAGRVDAFEPDPVNRARLESHIADNLRAGHDAPVRVHPVALASQPGTVTLFRAAGSDANHGMSSLFRDAAAGTAETSSSHQVPTARLDQLLAAPPDVVKIDIEGAEFDAIKGMAGILAGDRPPAMIIEHNPPSARAAGHTPADLFELLVSLQPRYRVWFIDWRLRPVRTAADLERFRPGNILVRAVD